MKGHIIKRVWRRRGPTGHKVKRFAYGYELRVNGRRERRVDSAWTPEDAERALAARILGLEQEMATRKAEAPGMTFGEAVARYLAIKEADGKRSLRNDRQHLAWWCNCLGRDTPLASITGMRIAEARTKLAEPVPRGKHKKPAVRAPSTQNRYLATLRHLFTLAVEEWEVLAKAPLVRLAKEPEGRLRYLSEDEITRLLAECACSQNPYLLAIVTVALYTGLRKGQILGLTWDRVDFARGVLVLVPTSRIKRAPREIPMADAVYAVLSNLRQRQRAADGTLPERGLLFRKANGAAWGNIRTAFELACQRAGIADFRFHDLRHTCASWLMMKGASPADVKEILAHTDFKMTLRYAHLSPTHLRAAIARLNSLATPRILGTKRAQSAKIEEAVPVSS